MLINKEIPSINSLLANLLTTIGTEINEKIIADM